MNEYNGPERRARVVQEAVATTNEKELGHLIASVESLKTDQNRTAKVLDDVYKKIDQLSSQFTDYKMAHDNQSAKDYKYLDTKIDDTKELLRKENDILRHRVAKIEHEREIEEAAAEAAKKALAEVEAKKAKSPGTKISDSMLDAIGKAIAAIGIGAFLLILTIYFANGAKWPG